MHMPLILTAMDRDVDSKTYGSCDRNYWHLKIRDFSSAILQQTCLTLALAYDLDFEGNKYFRNESVKTWSIAALRYMGKIQLKDGSFNEYYPNEHGFPPTAFNLYAGCKTYMILGLDDADVLQMLGKSAKWIINHDEKRAYNQEVAALAGLALYRKISNDDQIDAYIDAKVGILESVYCTEGWFPEQGGADIGYSSVSLDLLSEYYSMTGDKRVLGALHGMVSFLSNFVHPDGTIGGEYGSRNTIYFMPNGLENYIALGLDEHHVAAEMIERIYAGNLQDDFMLAVDERYLAHYVMHSYLRAISKYSDREHIEVLLPCQLPGCRDFKLAGLKTATFGEHFIIVCPSKGGILKMYRSAKEVFWDCGYRVRTKPGKTATTNWLDDSYEVCWENNGISIAGNLHVVKQKVQNPIYHLGLRVASKFLGDRVNKLIKKLTIFQKNEFSATFRRHISLSEERIVIEDWLEGIGGRSVQEASNISLRLVASGKFYSRSDILRNNLDDYGYVDRLHRTREIMLTDDKVNTVVETWN